MSTIAPDEPQKDSSRWDDKQSAGKNYGTFDVIKNFKWTLSRNYDTEEVPYVQLREFFIDESTITQQINFYTNAIINAAKSDKGGQLGPYEELYPKNKPSGNVYKLPYFSEVNFEVNTPVWQSLDTLEQGAKAAESIAGILGGRAAAEFVSGATNAIGAATGAVLAANYPKVGIMDRPRLWQNHDFRSITVKFPLFNTYDPTDWAKNRAFCWTLINSNLYYKRDFITGIPPVFYEVWIPGQHYSYASCVTNLTVNNRGNMRKFIDKKNREMIVPDAYDISITLTDMVMPSRNLFLLANDPTVKVS